MLIGATSATLIFLGLAAPATAASGVWVQQFGRASAGAECKPPANETPWQSSFRGQRAWTPSWSQWPNGGQGGWVCTRSVVWRTAGFPSAGCLLTFDDGATRAYANFNGGFSVATGAPVWISNPSCSGVPNTTAAGSGVYAPAGFDPVALCLTAFSLTVATRTQGTQDVYQCS